MHDVTIKNIKLPSPPAIALRILEAVKQDSTSFQDMARIIQVDPALTTKILQVANSSFYGMANKVHNIEKALSVLGLNVTKNIALSFVIAKEMTGSEIGGFNFAHFWRRAVTSAVGAELLASLLHYKNEDLFVSALLQDVGVLVIYLSRPEEYQSVLDEKRVAESSILDIERQIFGVDHQEIGADFLAQWEVPQSISTVIRYHHSSHCPEEVRETQRYLHWSTMLAAIYDGSNSVENVQSLKDAICPVFKVPAEAIDALVDAVAEKSIEILSFFEIDPGEMKPFSLLLQEANEELQRINLSYEQLVMQAKQARKKAEALAIELQAANARLRDIAFRDGLTGLYNYRYFQELLEKEVSRATRYHLPLALILFDIDNFKRINDLYGHPIGDEVLCRLAQTVQTTMRMSDIAVRYGGEEFAVILPMTELASCKVFGERLRRQIENMEIINSGNAIRITVSLGLASCESGMETMTKEQMVATADSAMYRAKQDGRNRVMW